MTLADRLRITLFPEKREHGTFMERESASQIEGGFAFLERGSNARESLIKEVEDLERQAKG